MDYAQTAEITHADTLKSIKDDLEHAYKAASKGSRLQGHYKKFVFMHHLQAAFLLHFDLGEGSAEMKANSEALQRVLVAIIQRHGLRYTTSELVVIRSVINDYLTVLASCGEEDFDEMVGYVDKNNYGTHAVLVTKRTLRKFARI